MPALSSISGRYRTLIGRNAQAGVSCVPGAHLVTRHFFRDLDPAPTTVDSVQQIPDDLADEHALVPTPEPGVLRPAASDQIGTQMVKFSIRQHGQPYRWRPSGRDVLLIASAALALVGCAPEPVHRPPVPEIEFGTARPTGDRLDVALTDEGLPDPWPDACATLRNEEITAILPQASSLGKTPEAIEFYPNVVTRPDGSYAIGSAGSAPRGTCVFAFDLPGEYSPVVPGSITVSLTAVGTPATIVEYYTEQKQEHGTGAGYTDAGAVWGAQECFLDWAGAYCRNGRFYLEVRTWSSRFQGVRDGRDQVSVWKDRVLPQLVTTLTARLS